MEGRRPVGGKASSNACSGPCAGFSMSLKQRACGFRCEGLRSLMLSASDLRQEPGAGKPHAGICGGGAGQSAPLPDRPGPATAGATGIRIVAEAFRICPVRHGAGKLVWRSWHGAQDQASQHAPGSSPPICPHPGASPTLIAPATAAARNDAEFGSIGATGGTRKRPVCGFQASPGWT